MIVDFRETIKALLDSLAQNNKDWDTRLVLADLYEEIGENVLAYGQRWQANKKRRPYYSISTNRWMWWSCNDEIPSSIPPELFPLLKRGKVLNVCLLKRVYTTVEEAERDLAEALQE